VDENEANKTCDHHNNGRCIYSSGFKNVSDKHTFYTKIYITLKIVSWSWSYKSFFIPYNFTFAVFDLTGNICHKTNF